MATSFKCLPCGYSNELKSNYLRHCESAKHLVKCPACPQTNTIDTYFKRIEVQVAEVVTVVQQNTVAIEAVRVEVAAAAQQNTVAIESVRAELAEVKAAIFQQAANIELMLQLERLKAENELLKLQLAARDQPKTRQVTGEPNKKTTKQVAKEAASAAAKATSKAAKTNAKEQAYVDSVEQEEQADVKSLEHAPLVVIQYVNSEERLCGNTQGYTTSREHREFMQKAGEDAMVNLLDGMDGDASLSDTLRGKQLLKPRGNQKRKRDEPNESQAALQAAHARQKELDLVRDMREERGYFNGIELDPPGEIREWLNRKGRMCRTNRAVTPEHTEWFNAVLAKFGLPLCA